MRVKKNCANSAHNDLPSKNTPPPSRLLLFLHFAGKFDSLPHHNTFHVQVKVNGGFLWDTEMVLDHVTCKMFTFTLIFFWAPWIAPIFTWTAVTLSLTLSPKSIQWISRYRHTHTSIPHKHTQSIPPKACNPVESVQLPSVLKPKALSQQMLFCYHRQLSLLAASDKTLLSDPDVKEFNLSDAPQEQRGGWGMSEPRKYLQA